MILTIEKHRVIAQNAPKFLEWIRERGGVAIWGCLDLGDAGKTWSSPVRQQDGQPYPKPHYSATSEPIRIITDPAEILVDVPKEVRRFHIAIRMGAQGFKVKLTDGSSRKVRKAVEQAGDGPCDARDA